MSGANFLRKGQSCCLILALGLLLLSFGETNWAAQESVQHYKMLASLEYSGDGQFSNQVETLLMVRKQLLSNGRVQYVISSDDCDLIKGKLDTEQSSSPGELSFVIDRKTGLMSQSSEDMGLLEVVNNHCVSSLKKVTKENIGETWKQSFRMPPSDCLFGGELELTLTAERLKTKAFGEVVAVKALSEPFIVKATGEKGRVGDVKSEINAVCLFDPEIEEVYLSVAVFEATTNINGFEERLRQQVGTYVTDAEGTSVSLRSLGWGVTKILWKMGVKKNGLKVKKESPLPQWAQDAGLSAGRVAQLCAATACEGAPNPIATVCVPAARTSAARAGGG